MLVIHAPILEYCENEKFCKKLERTLAYIPAVCKPAGRCEDSKEMITEKLSCVR